MPDCLKRLPRITRTVVAAVERLGCLCERKLHRLGRQRAECESNFRGGGFSQSEKVPDCSLMLFATVLIFPGFSTFSNKEPDDRK
jgi:hypothetical protein